MWIESGTQNPLVSQENALSGRQVANAVVKLAKNKLVDAKNSLAASPNSDQNLWDILKKCEEILAIAQMNYEQNSFGNAVMKAHMALFDIGKIIGRLEKTD